LIELFFVLSGVFAGTIAGLLPGVGVLTSLILVYPLIDGSTITELLLFYMALAATVQFTGTIPAVFAGLPGENNSVPAMHEGAKFARRFRGDIAVGVCALGSVLGAFIALAMFFLFSSFALQSFATIVSTRFQAILFSVVLISFAIFFNSGKIHINIAIIAIGIFLGMIGESPVAVEYRFTFGIDDLRWGLEKIPAVVGLIVIPILFNKHKNFSVMDKNIRTSFRVPMIAFLRNITSAIRASILGFLCGLVPGITTSLASTSCHQLESTLHPNKPIRKIIGAETGNNSGQFASLLPLLLFGIPITGSEIFLYGMLVDAGWNPNQLDSIASNVQVMLTSVVPWFVFVNFLGLIISWPMAKYSMFIFKLEYKYVVFFVVFVITLVTFYIGHINFREISYMIQLIFFSALGIALRKYNLLPMLAAFLLSDQIEGVVVREYLFFIN